MKNSILVTGAAGFVGSNIVQTLLSKGKRVVALDCFLPDLYSSEVKRHRWSKLLDVHSEGRLTQIEFDLRHSDFSTLDELGISSVINEAAMPGLNQNWNEFKTYYDCNISGLNRLLEWCSTTQITSFVQASTSSVYGLNAEGDETLELLPISPYGVSKVAAEKLLYAYHHRLQFPVQILRYFSIYGPSQRPDMAYSRICSALANDQVFEMYGDGNQRRSNTFVQDIVDATVLALESSQEFSIFNVSGAEDVSLNEAIEVLENVFEKKLKIKVNKNRIGDQLRTKGDSSQISETLGWKPKIDLQTGLKLQALDFMA
jgi:UDP-glucuronate 4-epimerase